MKYYEIMSCPGYRITKTGEIWSDFSKRQLTVHTNKDGYQAVGLKRHNGKRRIKRIHRLLLETFVGPCPEGMECRHLNGNRQDNRLCNLKWGTRSENVMDAVKHGTYNTRAKAKGEKHGMAKLTKRGIRMIVYTHRTKLFTQQEIANVYNITQTNVSSIINKRIWRHIWFVLS